MRIHIFTLIFYAACINGCRSQKLVLNENAPLKFLFKTKIDTSYGNEGQHIEINQILPNTEEMLPLSIDDRDIIGRSKYSRGDKIKILSEYLTFRWDTTVSNKKYLFKAANHMVSPEGVTGFTVQIEALYSFTRMLLKGYPPIKPILINRITGEGLNTNLKMVGEVYDIYSKWYNENNKSGFKNVILPLTDTPYGWLGEDSDMKLYLIKSF